MLKRTVCEFFITLTVLVTFVGVATDGYAQVMTSENYHIQSDSVNVGGTRSTSSSYTIEDTTGEIATGIGTSDNYTLYAGYQQMQEVYLALTAASDVTMSPTLTAAGGTSNGSTAVTATTDSPAGYQLDIRASSSPALTRDGGGASIADYTPAGAAPDFTFTTGSSDSHFGFSPEGTDIASRFQDNGTDTCNTGATDTSLSCWDGLSTSAEVIATSATPNHPNGTETTIRFRVGIGSSVSQLAGTYTATTTVTLVAL